MAEVSRKVKGSLRQRQTALTRNAILDAARALFRRQGYAATTIEQIATEAGVGLSTVYAVLTNKRTILVEMRWKAVQEAQVMENFRAALDEPEPVRRIELMVRITRQLYETGGDVFAVEHAAAGADPEVAEGWASHHRERGENLFKIVEPLQPHLASGLQPARALQIVQALLTYEVYEELVVISGWTVDEYETWVGRTLCDQLLSGRRAQPPGGGAHR